MIPNTNACIKDILCIVIYQDQIYLTLRFLLPAKNKSKRRKQNVQTYLVLSYKWFYCHIWSLWKSCNEHFLWEQLNWAPILIFVILMFQSTVIFRANEKIYIIYVALRLCKEYFYLGIFKFSDSIRASRIWCNYIPNTCMVIVYYYIKSFTATRKKIST